MPCTCFLDGTQMSCSITDAGWTAGTKSTLDAVHALPLLTSERGAFKNFIPMTQPPAAQWH